jgi:hypothetical protein
MCGCGGQKRQFNFKQVQLRQAGRPRVAINNQVLLALQQQQRILANVGGLRPNMRRFRK